MPSPEGGTQSGTDGSLHEPGSSCHLRQNTAVVVASGIDLSLEGQQSRKQGLTEVLPHSWPFGLDEISGCQLPALDKGAFPRKLVGINAFTETCCLHHCFHLSMLEIVVTPDGCSLGDMLADGFHLLFVHCKSAQDISAVTLFGVPWL